MDPAYISNNLLEYASIIFVLATLILAWEFLPTTLRPNTPQMLLWMDSTAAKAWTKCIAGLKSPQKGCSLACLFSHLLLLLEIGVHTNHIPSDNIIAD